MGISRNLRCLFLCASVVFSQQGNSSFSEDRYGSIGVTLTKSAMEIRRGGSKWRVPYLGLVRGIDCAKPVGADGQKCTAPPLEPCPACGLDIYVAGWDESRQTLYFAVTTSLSWEKPTQVLRYRLGNKHPQRLTNTWAAGVGGATVTKDGRYLAYQKWHHVAPAAGCVGNSPDVDVVDLWTLKAAQEVFRSSSPPQSNPPGWSSGDLKWRSSTELKITRRPLNEYCESGPTGPAVDLVLNVKELQFR